MGQRGEDLYQSLQKMEKDVALLYTIRRVLHLGITEDRAAADKALKLQSDALHKEFNNLKDQQKKITTLIEALESARSAHNY
jgi:cell division protein FtsB